MKFTYDGDLGLEEVANLFAAKEWPYAVDDCYGVPNEEQIRSQIGRMLAVMEAEDLDWVGSGRLFLTRDYEVRGAFQVHLTAGYVYAGDDDGTELYFTGEGF